MSAFQLKQDDDTIARMSRQHLESVLAVDSQSDEDSQSIPSTSSSSTTSRRCSRAIR